MILAIHRTFALLVTTVLPHLHLAAAISPNVSANIPPDRVPAPGVDLTIFNKPEEDCPGLCFGVEVRTPLPCENPECRGLASSTPPYRCRNRDGTYRSQGIPLRDYLLFGCQCCPSLVWCDDPDCAGSSDDRCKSELLDWCLCRRRTEEDDAVAIAGVVPAPIVANRLETAELENATVGGLEVQAHEPSSSSYSRNRPDSTGPTPATSDCPDSPPVKCNDPQCRGADDWRTSTRCNRPGGVLYIENMPVRLEGCPCCPDFIECHSPDCNGDAVSRTCLAEQVRGCFCDWPSSGSFLFANLPTSDQFLVNTLDSWFDAGLMQSESGPTTQS